MSIAESLDCARDDLADVAIELRPDRDAELLLDYAIAIIDAIGNFDARASFLDAAQAWDVAAWAARQVSLI